MLTQKRLREVLTYDPETGISTWAKGRRRGKIAGTTHDTRGSLKVAIDGQRHLLHRLAFLWMTGAMPRWSVEHIDGDHGNNQWENLREGDRIQKSAYRNQGREPTNVAGVFRVGAKFEATVILGNVIHSLDLFATMNEAETAKATVMRNARQRHTQARRSAA